MNSSEKWLMILADMPTTFENNGYERYLDYCSNPSNSNSEPDFELVYQCLEYAFMHVDEPMPEPLIRQLYDHMSLLRKGLESPLLKKQGTKPGAHPLVEKVERMAVYYIYASKKHDFDSSPIKTVCEIFGVAASTVHRWKKKCSGLPGYMDTVEMVFKAMGEDVISLADLRKFLLNLAPLYKKLKPQ